MDKETTKGTHLSPIWSPIFYMRFMIVDKSISPRSMANLVVSLGIATRVLQLLEDP